MYQRILFFSDRENEYKLLATKSKRTVNFLEMSLSLAPSKKYTMIEEFKDELKGLENILNEIKKTKITQRTRNKWIKIETKRKLNMLDDEISYILKKLDVELPTLELRKRFCEKLRDLKRK